jgi:hypothetical protein
MSDDHHKENMEMTQNQVYGVPLARGTRQEAVPDITMEENVGYGVANRNDPQPPQDESYEYI